MCFSCKRNRHISNKWRSKQTNQVNVVIFNGIQNYEQTYRKYLDIKVCFQLDNDVDITTIDTK